MEKINIICVDDEDSVLDAVTRDLRPLEKFFRIESASSADECLKLMNETIDKGEFVGLVISDHVMPEPTGVELLGSISKDSHFNDTRKILLTGQADHTDTIKAINEAHIDNYLEKPWKADALLASAKTLLTKFIMEKGIEYEDYLPILDKDTLFTYLKK